MNKTSTRVLLLLSVFALFVVPVVALAAAGFDDVDDDNVFVADIQWMKDNEITKGCNPPTNTNFCPDKAVTRQQMAAFMRRLAVSGVVDSDTLDGKDSSDFLGKTDKAANADKLDGKELADIAPMGAGQVDETVLGTVVFGPTEINAVIITVPSNGVIIISGSAFIKAASNGFYGLKTFVGETEIGKFSAYDDFTALPDDKDAVEWLSYSTAAAVAPGTYVVSQKIGRLNDVTGKLIDGQLFYNANTLTATFVPGGAVGAAPTGNPSGVTIDGQ